MITENREGREIIGSSMVMIYISSTVSSLSAVSLFHFKFLFHHHVNRNNHKLVFLKLGCTLTFFIN